MQTEREIDSGTERETYRARDKTERETDRAGGRQRKEMQEHEKVKTKTSMHNDERVANTCEPHPAMLEYSRAASGKEAKERLGHCCISPQRIGAARMEM